MSTAGEGRGGEKVLEALTTSSVVLRKRVRARKAREKEGRKGRCKDGKRREGRREGRWKRPSTCTSSRQEEGGVGAQVLSIPVRIARCRLPVLVDPNVGLSQRRLLLPTNSQAESDERPEKSPPWRRGEGSRRDRATLYAEISTRTLAAHVLAHTHARSLAHSHSSRTLATQMTSSK